MKKTAYKIFCVLLSAMMLLTLAPAFTALADDEPVIVSSGYCGAEGDGTNLTWTLDSAGTLVISGSGSVKSHAFEQNNDIRAIILEEGVAAVGRMAFAYCYNTVSVSIPDTVSHIETQGFYFNRALESLEIPGSVEQIDYFAFNGCTALRALTSVALPDSLVSVSDYAFTSCAALASLELPAGVSRIGCYGFSYSGLTEINIPAAMTEIEEGAFSGCKSLTGITVPGHVTKIGRQAFSADSALTSVDIAAGVTETGSLRSKFSSPAGRI